MLIPFVALAVLHLVVQGADARGKNRKYYKSVHSASTDSEEAFEYVTENEAGPDIDPTSLPSEAPKNGSLARNAEEISPSAHNNSGDQEDPSYENATCGSPRRMDDAITRLRGNEHDIGTVATYSCVSGYVRQGSGKFQSVCEVDEDSGGGLWSVPSVVCVQNVTCNLSPKVKNAKTNIRGKKHGIGRVATYRCNSGYTPQGSGEFQSVCEFDEESGRGRWTVPNVVCIGTRTSTRKPETSTVHKATKDPEDALENVSENAEVPDVDSRILPTEVPGRESLNGNAEGTSQSESDNFGDGEDPSHDRTTCDRPPPVEGAITPRVRGAQHAIGTVVIYSCDFGFVSRGSAKFQSVCERDGQSDKGQWSDPNVVCIPRSCGDPGFVINARRIGSVFTFPYTVEFECEEGYKLNGAGVRYCQASGLWSGKLPTCEQVYCERPSNPENGRVRYIALEYGTELRYECNKGFILSNHQQRYCTENGTWSNEEPVCIEANCDEPHAPEHGFRQLTDGLKVDSLVIYSCEEKKVLVGASTSKCLSDGQWTFPPPKCVDQCQVPYVQNGRIGEYEIRRKYRGSDRVFVPFSEGKKVNPGETGTLQCHKDFVPEEGSQTSEIQVTCEDGTWSVPLQCISVSCHGDPPPIENGSPVVSKNNHGHIIYYDCDEFYEKTAIGRVACVYGKWEGYTPVCSDARCYTSQLNFPGLVKPDEEFIAHKKDFSISCEEGYRVTGQKNKISCKLGKWEINYNPCIKEFGCPVIDEKGIFNVRYNNHRRVDSAAYYYCKEEDRKILGSNTRTCQENGEWSGVDPECVVESEVRCPAIDEKDIFNVRYNNDRKVYSAVYYFCKEENRKISGSFVRNCQENGEWSSDDPECVEEAPSSFSVSTAKTPGTISPPKSTSEKRTQTAAPVTGSLDSQNRDDCCCVSDLLNTNVLFSDEGVKLLLGVKVKKGDTVQITCLDKTAILAWRNGLRASGPVTLTCDTCRTWNEEDIPSCTTGHEGDTAIVFNRKMKLLPGGIVEVRQSENIQIQCSTLSIESQVNYPAWRTSPPKRVKVLYNNVEFERGFQLNTFLDIDEFKAELTGRYECYAGYDGSGHRYAATILNLKIAAPEVRCPILDEKDIFIINYSDSRKVNSIAVYFCRKQTQGPKGIKARTCLENGEWTREEDPSCEDIICPKFNYDRYVNAWYSNLQYVGSVATFYCSSSRILIGSSTSTCLGNGTWSHSLPACELPSGSHCPQIDGKGNFIINYSNGRKVNSVAYYYCGIFSQKIHGSNTRTCRQNGEWTGSDPVCVDITCREFVVSGSLTVFYTDENKVGSKAEFHCTPPAVLEGSFTARCLVNSTWSSPQPSCVEPEVRCPAIDDKGIFTVRYQGDRKVSSAAYYDCKEKDDKMTGSDVRVCQENGEWSDDDPECVAPGCQMEALLKSLPPDVVPNEENVTGELVPPGFELSLLCDNGMILIGNKKVKCNQQGRWNIENMQCVFGCFLDYSNSASALIIEPVKDLYRFGEFAVLSCPEGFELTTEVERVMCMGSSGWSDTLPECKKIVKQ